MATKNKYKPDVSWVDVVKSVHTHEVEYGLRIQISLPTVGRNDGLIAVRVDYYDPTDDLDGPLRPIHSYMGSMPARTCDQASAVMYTVHAAWVSYLNNPWVWSRAHRTRVAHGLVD